MLTVVILTFNEDRHIARAIASVKGLAEAVFVIDSGSTDQTVEVAKAHGATVLSNPWVNHAVQFQWAMDILPIATEWVMRLDADEVIEPDLVQALMAQMPALPTEVTGINLDRKHVFMGRWIKNGGRYPVTLLRIWRKGCARIEQKWMDEHMILLKGRAVTIKGGFADINLSGLTDFTAKHNKYATLEAVEVLSQKYGLWDKVDAIQGAPKQAAFKRGIKEKVYNRLPFGAGPVLYFLYRYIIQLGFLDGKEGAIYHGLQGLWYRYLVDAKILEFDRALSTCPTREDKLACLKSLTGLKL